MFAPHRRRLAGMFLAACLALVALPNRGAEATLVSLGWDLFETAPGTVFEGVPFVGVALGSFDFGSPIGVQPTGTADTIVRRLDVANVPVPPGMMTIDTELVALHLQSTFPVDFGLGLGFYFLTLQSERGGPASTGMANISFADANGGTIDSFFDVFFDIRLGGLSGPIALSGQDRLSSQSRLNMWDRTPLPGAVTISGVNINLNGTDNTTDFWPNTPITYLNSRTMNTHGVILARVIPEASSALFGLAVSLLSGLGYAGRAVCRR